MPKPVRRLQPRSYDAFRCIGAECEDTCCIGWNVNVDKRTFEAYQRSDDPELGPRLRELITINTEAEGDDDYARITLSGATCPFFSEGLCAIQKKLGEGYLPIMCARYPRAMNVVDDVVERSLDLSCPEAARLMLLDANTIEFTECEGGPGEERVGSLPVLETSIENSQKPFTHFREIRGLIIWLLQHRADPLWKRLVILGSLCDQLHETAATGAHSQIPEVLEGYRDAVERDLFDQAMKPYRAQTKEQLELALELIVARISSDFTAPRFLGCYREFMQGLEWTTESSMTDLGRRYQSAFVKYYAPFMSRHEYMLEHYLVSYVFRTLFPLGPQVSHSKLSARRTGYSIRDECLLMLVHYGIVQALLIGLAGFHKSDFDAGVVLKLIQSSARTFEHSVAFPGRALEILASKGANTCASLAMLLRT